MKGRILNLLAILTSLVGYLEWGSDSSAFLCQAELEIIGKVFSEPQSLIHPFIILPLFGQILLLISLFQKEPSRWMSLLGIGCIALLLLFVALVGVLGQNPKVVVSTLPFLICAFLILRNDRRRKRTH